MAKIDTYLPTTAGKWNSKIPLDFPQTTNISTSFTAPAHEILMWRGDKLTNKYLRTKTPVERDEIAKDVFNYLLKCNFDSYRIPEKRMLNDWENIKDFAAATEIINGETHVKNMGNSGSKVYKYFFPNLMKLKNGKKLSVYECLKDKETLWKIVRNRVGNTLIYAEKKGETARQYPMTLTCLNMFIQGAKASGQASIGSQFKPGVAKAIYERFVKDGDVVLDYSCGYGARLLGLASLGKKVKYCGYEPCTETYSGLIKMSKYFEFDIDIKKCGSEEELFEDKFDFAFSSPPYFDQETYSTEATQCYNKYTAYDDFMEKYWRKTVKNIKQMLKPNAIFGVNAGNSSNEFMQKITTDFKKTIEDEGFGLVEAWCLDTPRSHLTSKRSTQVTMKPEGIYFYRLGV